MSKLSSNTLLLYAPAWHRGYQLLLDKVKSQISEVWLIDGLWARTQLDELDYLRKEIRALEPTQVKKVIETFYPKLTVVILNEKTIRNCQNNSNLVSTLIIPMEDVSRLLARALFPKVKTKENPIFLRWDRARAIDPEPVEVPSLTIQQLARKMLTKASEVASQSSDWWRHVGAVLAKSDQVIFAAANRHKPTDHTPYITGDLRQLFNRNKYTNYSSAEHAETAVIAQAAARGISTKGAQLYCTTFPCPYCAHLVAHSGISKLYFAEGYANLDGQVIMEDAGVKIHTIRLDEETLAKQDQNSILLPYPSDKK